MSKIAQTKILETNALENHKRKTFNYVFCDAQMYYTSFLCGYCCSLLKGNLTKGPYWVDQVKHSYGSRYQTLSTLAKRCPSSSQTCCCPARERREPGDAWSLARRREWERRCLDRRRRHQTQSTKMRTREPAAAPTTPQNQRSSGTSTTPGREWREEKFNLKVKKRKIMDITYPEPWYTHNWFKWSKETVYFSL